MSQRATGLPWNSTFADAAEKVRDVASGQTQVAITGLVTLLGPHARLRRRWLSDPP